MESKKNNITITTKLFSSLLRSWWVILFLLICFFGYDLGIKKRNKAIFEMRSKYESLLEQQKLATTKKEDLQLRFAAQSDPAWIEMVLMKELGVVPENQIKVHFKN
ncbi:MAG: hypothetical protein KR126chlam6_00052 [Candidatus Anoxychlamydiales bacterium]|nr:hypothetical protein [Candidatus Anoxychlamydiales bacterium]